MYHRFFYKYRSWNDLIGDLAERKRKKLKANVIEFDSGSTEIEERQQRFLEKQNKYMRAQEGISAYLEDINIWYLDALAKNDVTKYEAVRQSLINDAFRAMKEMLT